MHKLLPASLALVLATPFGASADPAADLRALRRDVAAMREAYEARLQSLERRLRAAEAGSVGNGAHRAGGAAAAALPGDPVAATSGPHSLPADASSAASVTAAAAAGMPARAPGLQAGAGTQAAAQADPPTAQPFAAVAPSPSPPSSLPTVTAAAPAVAGGNAFNPAISLILSGLYGRSSRDPADYAIAGFALPPAAAIGPGTRGFSLAESELALSASIDPWLRGAAHFSLHADNSFSVEEAFVQTTALGGGFAVKAGRFYSGVGYLNPRHAHTWDFVDNPLAYQAMLGTQYGDDGVQLTWLAPTEQYVEFGAELGRGRGFPGSDASRNGAGMRALFAHAGGDIGDSHSWRAGLSVLDARADEQTLLAVDTAGRTVANAFTGSSRVWIADGVWKWAPNGNATRTSFKLQGEYLRSTRSGSLVYDLGGVDGAGSLARRAVGLVRAGRLAVPAPLAARPAHRAARRRIARLRRERRRARRQRLAAEKEHADGRLQPERVLARSPAARPRPGARRPHRQPAVPAVPDEPGRARRAPLLSAASRRPEMTRS